MKKKSPLIVIDMQKAFLHPSMGKRNHPQAEQNIMRLLQHWRENKQPVIFIQHISTNPNSLFYPSRENEKFIDFMREIKPMQDELVIKKKVNSAFIGTNLEEILKEMQSSSIVIVGFTTNHCVETTTRMAGNLGFNPVLVTDACAAFERKGRDGKIYSPELIHEMTMVNLNEEFAEIKTTNELLCCIEKKESIKEV